MVFAFPGPFTFVMQEPAGVVIPLLVITIIGVPVTSGTLKNCEPVWDVLQRFFMRSWSISIFGGVPDTDWLKTVSHSLLGVAPPPLSTKITRFHRQLGLLLMELSTFTFKRVAPLKVNPERYLPNVSKAMLRFDWPVFVSTTSSQICALQSWANKIRIIEQKVLIRSTCSIMCGLYLCKRGSLFQNKTAFPFKLSEKILLIF